MFVSLPTGQVSGLFSFRCLLRTGPDRVFRTVLAVKRLFSFSSANLFSLTQLQKLVNHFFIFYRIFTGALHLRASAFVYYQFRCDLSTLFSKKFFSFYENGHRLPSGRLLTEDNVPTESGRTSPIRRSPL